MTQATQLLEQQNGQRANAKERIRRATKDDLARKKRARLGFSLTINEGDDPVSFKFVALSPTRYDEIVAAHPATPAQAKLGHNINRDTFPSALLAEVCVEPRLTEQEWHEQVFANDEWGIGERATLLNEASALCQRQLDLSPFDSA